ncbi:30S ribosomal protein S7, partial [Candidatus Peregrinibacteria bacterium]|nr:30S ribosomal protein S7 [Candidatus Peregrinibacteria bacterium]
INYLMLEGKKSTARKIFNNTLKIISKKTSGDPEKIFKIAIENVKPQIEIRAKRIGGAVYQIPTEVKPDRQLAVAFRWLIGGARGKKGAPMAEKLASELIDASNEQGSAFKKKEDTHRMAQANKAFAHLARY